MMRLPADLGAQAPDAHACARSDRPASRGTRTPGWWYFRESAARRCPIINYCGGTEIAGGIVGCLTIAPSAPCSFRGPVPGMAADVSRRRRALGPRRGRRARRSASPGPA
jgi:acetyl-CoA synthetase